LGAGGSGTLFARGFSQIKPSNWLRVGAELSRLKPHPTDMVVKHPIIAYHRKEMLVPK
jgi:hypothetical protein